MNKNLDKTCKKNIKKIKVRPITLRKRTTNGYKEYRYYIIPLNLYINKAFIEKWGYKYELEITKCQDEIVLKVKPIKTASGTSAH